MTLRDIDVSDTDRPAVLDAREIGWGCKGPEGLTVVDRFTLIDCGEYVEVFDTHAPG